MYEPVDWIGVDRGIVNLATTSDGANPAATQRILVVDDEEGLADLLAIVLRRLRAYRPDLPVLFLTAREGVEDRIAGLRVGTKVTVTVRTDADEAVIRVAGDGPGIPPDLLPRVFERFARGDASRSRATGSSGLGLAIVAAVSAAHGGRADVSSEPGRTVFTMRLPLCPAYAGEVNPPRKPVGHELPYG
ncbi:ATP-binding protein [Streptomyces sp. NPDC059629]|uniref:ATP-binding response regulator n=1 Tax=Streptomyces sp. NPDC059629 TaxID=3346889 RepID=UPI0036BFC5AB